MNGRTTGRLLLAVCLLGGFIGVFERGTHSTDERSWRNRRLTPIEPANVTYLAIKTAALTLECEQRKAGWYVIAPVEAWADAAGIRRILETLGALRRKDVVTARQREERGLTLASYGLDEPQARFVIGAGDRRDEIAVGLKAPLGDVVYARVNRDEDVVATDEAILAIVPPSAEALRDRQLFHGDVQRISRLEIKHAGGFIQLARRSGGWRLQQPLEAPGDNRRIDRMLAMMRGLTAEGFAADSRRTDPITYGLVPEDAILQISAWIEGSEQPVVLLFGKVKEDDLTKVYARISDSAAIFTVSKDVVAALQVKPVDLRDRRVCPANPGDVRGVVLQEGERKLTLEKRDTLGWFIQEPVRSKADDDVVNGLLRSVCSLRAVGFVDAPATNLAALGLETPACRIAFSEQPVSVAATNVADSAPAPESNTVTVLISRWGGAQDPVYAMCNETRSMFRVGAAEIGRLTGHGRAGAQAGSLTDPRVYMDRLVLNVGAANIKRITLRHDGIEESVARDVGGAWAAESPPDSKVLDSVVSDMLAAVAGLRAARIESIASERPASYGLDDAAVRLTLGLTGTAGIQKTLIVGSAAGVDGVYAILQGQDTVFVLGTNDMARLTRSLVRWQ